MNKGQPGGEAAASRHRKRRKGMLGLGSNIGDRRAHLQAAVDALPRHGVTRAALLLDL